VGSIISERERERGKAWCVWLGRGACCWAFGEARPAAAEDWIGPREGKEVLGRAEQRRTGRGMEAELGQRREAERATGAEAGQQAKSIGGRRKFFSIFQTNFQTSFECKFKSI